MIVARVAETKVDWTELSNSSGYQPHKTVNPWNFLLPEPPDELAEAAGRMCYKSYDRPNPKTASTKGYVANIINQQHFSVLEHATVTYHISGVSRSLLTELERHRHLSFSVISQRYVDHSENYVSKNYVYPPVFEQLDVSQQQELKSELDHVILTADGAYSRITEILVEAGLKKKEVREAARAVLPQAVTTEFLMTGNLRTYREILQKRLSPTADAEIRQFARKVLMDLMSYAPATFQDFKLETS